MRPVLLFLLAVAACTQFPELDARVGAADRSAAFPALLPAGPIIAAANAVGPNAQAANAGPDARIAALRQRAQGLRAPVIPAPVRARMIQGVDRGALQ